MSVAIRTITRLQDGDDAPTLGAGQDGYALTWDNATSAFVATALPAAGVTDHGALTGLTGDSLKQALREICQFAIRSASFVLTFAEHPALRAGNLCEFQRV